MILKDQKSYNLHYNDVRGELLQLQNDTIPADLIRQTDIDRGTCELLQVLKYSILDVFEIRDVVLKAVGSYLLKNKLLTMEAYA